MIDYKFLDMDMVIETTNNPITAEDFIAKFIEWIEGNNWYCGGGVKPVDENGNDWMGGWEMNEKYLVFILTIWFAGFSVCLSQIKGYLSEIVELMKEGDEWDERHIPSRLPAWWKENKD